MDDPDSYRVTERLTGDKFTKQAVRIKMACATAQPFRRSLGRKACSWCPRISWTLRSAES